MNSLRLNLNGLFDQLGVAKEEVSGDFWIDGTQYQTTRADMLEEVGHEFPIGAGRFGTVYRKRHRPTGIVMAEKIVSKSSVKLEKYVETEKQLWRHAKNDYLVNHYGAIDTALNVHLFFEMMNTCFEKLQERLRVQPGEYFCPEEVLAKVAYSTYSALYYLKEAHSVVHRDIKPSNILVGNDGSVKVTDFGLARKLIDSRAYTRGIGCLGYISPERIHTEGNDKGYGAPADVWSLGITLYELATGKHPILQSPDMTELSILITIAEQEPPQLTDADPFGENFKSFTNLCLRKNPKERIVLGSEHAFLKSIPTDQSMLAWCQQNDLLKV